MYKIIVDSCGEFTEKMKENPVFVHAPLELSVGDWHQTDDETFDQAVFLKKVAESEECPKSACPSPEKYIRHFEGCDEVYIVTLSGNLSGSYNAARTAVDIYYEDHPDAKIHVFDSCSASVGETLIAMRIYEAKQAGKTFAEVVEEAETYRSEMNTFFVLDNLDTLRKNGRLSNIKAFIASTLNIKPIMGGDKKGVIYQAGQKIGIKKALIAMCEEMIKVKQDLPGRILMISHCNAPKRAAMVADIMKKTELFSKIVVLDTDGVSSMYANDGGVIMVC
ncbi:MAG: DegV family protein [Lachnospiraceae bacterium]|nr:DegV family protein [Lachnospiraceae bacterium]